MELVGRYLLKQLGKEMESFESLIKQVHTAQKQSNNRMDFNLKNQIREIFGDNEGEEIISLFGEVDKFIKGGQYLEDKHKRLTYKIASSLYSFKRKWNI